MSTADAGRLAVVVGGASGSGFATARALAESGDEVLIADINGRAADAAADELRADGTQASSAVVDISDLPSVAAFARHVRTLDRPVDVLYNSAAITDSDHQRADTTPAEVPVDIWNRTLAVDLTGVMLTCQALLPLMRAPGGVIVNVTSNAGLRGSDTLVSYGVAKAGLHQLTRAIATAYGHLGIRCNALSPASIVSESFLRNVDPEIAQRMRSVCLLPELGRVDDVAALARFLCSRDAAYITGEIVRVDGGALGHLPGTDIPGAAPGGPVPPRSRPHVIAGHGPVADAVAGRLVAAGADVSNSTDDDIAPRALFAIASPTHATDVDAVIRTMEDTARRMAAAGGGAIVAAIGTAGSGSPDAAEARARITARTLRIATDRGRSGVRANVVAFDPAVEVGARTSGALLPDAGRPDDVAGPALFLASDAARFVTGTVVRVDGGRHARLPHTVGLCPPHLDQEYTT